MKKILLLFAAASLFAVNTWAQAPQSFNYQAVVRNNSGAVVASQNVSVRLTIHDGSSSGTTVYQETKSLTTNQFGLITHAIGTGTVTNGTFAGINWGSGTKWLQVEVDASGGNSYTDMGTSQLLSVPYALYAANGGSGGTTYTAGNGINIQGNTISNSMPDQQVNITNGAGISISGGYPNFTITNTQPDQQVNISGSGNVSVSGSYPNFTISSSGGGGSLSGSGTSNYVPKWTNSTTLGNSLLRDNGSVVYIGSQNGTNQLEVDISSSGGKDAVAGKTTGNQNGVFGLTNSSNNTTAGVYGKNDGSGAGVRGRSQSGAGVAGVCYGGTNNGVYGESIGSGNGIYGYNTSTSGHAGYFQGKVYATGTITQNSDERMKQDIKPLGSILPSILQLQASTYVFKSEFTDIGLPEGKQCGLIAQQLEKLFPGLVEESTLKDKGADVGEYKTVNYIGLIPYLVKAIQEQQALINALQQKVESLRKPTPKFRTE